MILVGNHWPSRRGGVLLSEPYRIMAAETLSYWTERIQHYKGKDAPILIMGDFNDEPHSRSIAQYALGTNCAERVRTCKIPRLLDLMWPLMGQGLGTNYYENFPNMLDQFLVSKGFLGSNGSMKVKKDSVRIERYPEMMTGTFNIPRRFGRPSSKLDEKGFSDHFPISVVIEEA